MMDGTWMTQLPNISPYMDPKGSRKKINPRLMGMGVIWLQSVVQNKIHKVQKNVQTSPKYPDKLLSCHFRLLWDIIVMLICYFWYCCLYCSPCPPNQTAESFGPHLKLPLFSQIQSHFCWKVYNFRTPHKSATPVSHLSFTSAFESTFLQWWACLLVIQHGHSYQVENTKSAQKAKGTKYKIWRQIILHRQMDSVVFVHTLAQNALFSFA